MESPFAFWVPVMLCLAVHGGVLAQDNVTFAPDDLNSTFVGETVLQIQPSPPEIDLAELSVQHFSSVQAFVRSGSHYLEPLVSFLQGLFSSGEVHHAAPIRGFADRRQILLV
jgi:hypothetical protein